MAALSLVQATDIVDAALDKARCSYPAARIGARNFPPGAMSAVSDFAPDT